MKTVEHSAGVFVYTVDDGRMLFLVLQKTDGEYDIPKGHVESGEDYEQAAIRETFEEAGIKPVLVPFYSDSTTYYFKKEGKLVQKHLALFLAKAESKKVTISSEHMAYSWETYEAAVKKLKHKDLVEIMPRMLEYAKRFETMKKLNKEYAKLPYEVKGWDLSRTLVPGEGRLDSGFMILGQAPGANEEIQKRPFIGRSGKLLDLILKGAGLRRENAYITSVAQFFPPKNRIPSDKEIALCRLFLLKQIEILKPRCMVLLGNVASKAMLGTGEVEKNHGKRMERDGIMYMVTFHPAAALRFKRNVALMEKDMKGFANDILNRSS